MSSWGNTDALTDKPHWPEERQIRVFASLVTANNTTVGNTVIKFTNNGGSTPLANLGIVAGMSMYAANVSTTGEQEFFVANNRVASVSGNNVVMTSAVFGTVPAGATIDFGIPIVYNSNTANAYFSDTVLVTTTRLPNTSTGFANTATAHTGWVKVTTGVGGRAGRRQVEVLVALSNTATANATSGNTSNSQTYYAGL